MKNLILIAILSLVQNCIAQINTQPNSNLFQTTIKKFDYEKFKLNNNSISKEYKDGDWVEMELRLPFTDKKQKYFVQKNGNYFLLEDDIVIDNKIILNNYVLNNYSTVTNNNSYKWSNNNVPYIITCSNSSDQKIVSDAIRYLNDNLCIKFIPRKDESDYIDITVRPAQTLVEKSAAGSSAVGRQGGKQVLFLKEGSFGKMNVVHEALHIIGVYHEMSRDDRDKYIKINENNIKQELLYNFKNEGSKSNSIGAYDYCSVMHYGQRGGAITINGQTLNTFDCIDKNKNIISCPNCIGQRDSLSILDIEGVCKLYDYACSPIEALNRMKILNTNNEVKTNTGGVNLSIMSGNINYTQCEKVPNFGSGYYLSGINNSTIYYSCIIGEAFAIWGDIRNKYHLTGGSERGILGFPVFNHSVTPNKTGAYCHFQGGSIYWSPNTGSHTIWGAIRDKWKNIGWENSELGFPKTDEIKNPNNVGVRQEFENGIMYWSDKTGAHYVKFGEIFNTWSSLNWEQGVLGLPIEEAKLINGVLCQKFQGGEICGNKVTYNNIKISLTLKQVDKFGGIRSYGEVGVVAYKPFINGNIEVFSLVGNDAFFYCHNREQWNQNRETINKEKIYEFRLDDINVSEKNSKKFSALIRLFYRIEGQYEINDDNHKGILSPSGIAGSSNDLKLPMKNYSPPSTILANGHFSDCNGYLGRDLYEYRDISIKDFYYRLINDEVITLTEVATYDKESVLFTYELKRVK